jgi:hypothetical protein
MEPLRMTPWVTSSLAVPCSHIRSKMTLEPPPTWKKKPTIPPPTGRVTSESDQSIVITGDENAPPAGRYDNLGQPTRTGTPPVGTRRQASLAETTPAQQGVMRVPSGGNRLLGVLVRTVIQCASSQLLLGKVILPLVKVSPAASWIVSPHPAAFNASWSF